MISDKIVNIRAFLLMNSNLWQNSLTLPMSKFKHA